jgi:hypothetical protein
MLINSSELRATGSNLKEVLLHHLRQLHVVVCTREEQDCEVLRIWVLTGLSCQWMTTLNSGHDVSESSLFFTLKFIIFPINLFKKKIGLEIDKYSKGCVRLDWMLGPHTQRDNPLSRIMCAPIAPPVTV